LATLRAPEGRILIPGFYDAIRPPDAEQHAALVDMPDTEDVTRAIYGIDHFEDNLTGVALRERAAFGPTCNIAGLVSGYTGEGTKTVLPAKASAKIDFRLVPDQNPQDILAKLRTHLDARGYDDIIITVLGGAAPTVTPITDPFVQRVMAITEAYSSKPPVIIPISGGSLPLLDALQRFVGVPGLFAPGNPAYWESSAHAPNENIRLDHLQEAVRFNCALFRELGK
jgi:acetylornithine deacetylase/succinyl-diaminopimelate desuccinylase-like protein